MGLALAIAALVSQLVMLPGMNGLIRAREEQKVTLRSWEFTCPVLISYDSGMKIWVWINTYMKIPFLVG